MASRFYISTWTAYSSIDQKQPHSKIINSLEEIEHETRLPIEVEEVYSWMAFVSARHNPNIPVANRFFGLQPDGEYKIRGLAMRREDTPLFVDDTQQRDLEYPGERERSKSIT